MILNKAIWYSIKFFWSEVKIYLTSIMYTVQRSWTDIFENILENSCKSQIHLTFCIDIVSKHIQTILFCALKQV